MFALNVTMETFGLDVMWMFPTNLLFIKKKKNPQPDFIL